MQFKFYAHFQILNQQKVLSIFSKQNKIITYLTFFSG